MLFDRVRRVKDKKPMIVTGLEYSETISAITPDDMYYGDQEDYHESKIEPIPLTAEILEKNGFDVTDSEVAQYHFEEDGQKMHFSLRKMYDKHGKHNGYSFWAFNILPLVIYVHELQHALKLCGIDKEITV